MAWTCGTPTDPRRSWS